MHHKTLGRIVSIATFCGLLMAVANTARAVPVTPTDLDTLALGATIVGPAGPTVDTVFINADDQGIGDLVSSVSCPAGIAPCVPPDNPPGTIYTYIHQVTPGVDLLPNDSPPLPEPGNGVVPIDAALLFELGFEAFGFNGVAGFSFSQAGAALTSTDAITIELLADNSLAWQLPPDAGWDSGESITFFWQTTQPPSGPGGVYGLANADQSGTARGPLPSQPTAVPAPGTLALYLLAGLLALRRYNR